VIQKSKLRHLLFALGEKGTSILECALTLPLLVALMLGLFDISTLMLNSMALEQAAREGARTASKIAVISTGVQGFDLSADPVTGARLDTPANITACNSIGASNPGAALCNNVLVHARIRHIIRNQRYLGRTGAGDTLGIDPNDILISSEVVRTSANPTVTVRLDGVHRGLLVPNYPIHVAYQGPYLFR
jgi:hypothetical protein